MIRFVLASFAVLAFLAQTAFAQLAVTPLTIKSDEASHAFTVEIASTEDDIRQGLMFRESLAPDAGMLFDFGQVRPASMWMKNTLIPLSVAFIADDGSIVNLDEMKPETLTPHCSTKPVRFVLEMNTGWFSKRGIKAGLKVTGKPFEQAAPTAK